ncbi:nucleotide sugar dehydrogenase [Streptomyces sp. LX-29]|nr:nucleotide sugar dehydrogenase [Streptomyces sp. LX-29]WFB11336.1 nucleotide sugar dehydrogenase [Streptomyces sp. LX-29]
MPEALGVEVDDLHAALAGAGLDLATVGVQPDDEQALRAVGPLDVRYGLVVAAHEAIPHASPRGEDVEVVRDHRPDQVPLGIPHAAAMATHTASSRLRFTTDITEAAAFADVHFLAVGTPIDADGRSYDTGQVFGAARALAPHMRRPCVIIGKSTVTVGTTRTLAALVARLAPAGSDAEVVWNPEFLREGHAIDDTLRPDRIVVGVPSPRAEDVGRRVYAPLLENKVPLFVTDPATAELIKGAANAYLGMKISFINGVADMCAAAGADVQQLTEAIGLDPRIGRGGLNAGPGYGGGCLPKDVRAFTASAEALGALDAASLLRAAEHVNESRPAAALRLIEETLGRPVTRVKVTVCVV